MPFVILFCTFALVAATDDDDDGIGEIIVEITAFIIGDVIGSCSVNPECAAVFGPLIFYMTVVVIVLTIILTCCCGYDDDYYGSSRRYNRRAAMFGAGLGWGAIRNR
tara:strand:+ start:267 stop:587 length:321 start_codon:yes stop_codon:yes gene_type:complete